MRKLAIILWFCLLVPSITMGQEYYFKHYKVEDGLSHNTVTSSIQDENGFMWFGTKDGLNRFDGYSFRLFQNDPKKPKSLQGNYIESLHEFDGTIWVGTHNGLSSYNEKNEEFEILEETYTTNIKDIENDNNGNLWYIASGSLNKYNTKTKKNHVYPKEQYFRATAIVRTSDNQIWVSSINQLYQYIEATNSFKIYPLNVTEDVKYPFRIHSLFNLNKDTILLGTHNHGVLSFNLKDTQIKNMFPNLKSPIYVKDIALNGEHELWIASESGIHIYNLKTHSYTNLIKDYNDPYALSDNAVYTLTFDKEGGIWAGTYFGGINYHTIEYLPFKKFFPNASKNSISGNAVRQICSDKYGNIWIGTEDAGLNKYNPKTGMFTNYKSKSKGGILSHHNIHGVLPVDDKIWIGTFNNGLDILDIKSGQLIGHYDKGESHNLLDNFGFSLYQTRAKKTIVISPSAIQWYNPETKKFSHLNGFPKKNIYTCLLEDNEGVIWVGTNFNGLYYYNPKTNEKRHFKRTNNDTLAISNNNINNIFQDSSNRIWITTENGLNLFDDDKRKLKKYGAKDGFPSNVFYSILEEDTNKLWISTSNGLVAFNTETGNKKIYTKSNGLLTNQFNYNSSYKAPDGTMYFGSVNGLISFNPKNFIKKDFTPKIFITGLQINKQEVIVNDTNSPLKKSITFLNKLELKPNESSFSLGFASLSFNGSETTEYWYKMKGISDAWIPLKNNHSAHFTELPAGSYSFSVKSLSYNGVWSHESPPLKIEVLPVFWKSNIAYALYSILTLLLVFFTMHYYHKRTESINRQKIKEFSNKKEKEIYQSKIEFFTNISHEIRTPLTLIKIPLDKIIKYANNNPVIKENLSIMEKNTSRLLDLVNQLLDFRKTEIEGISLTFVETNFTALIKNTHHRFTEAIKDKNIDFKLNFKAKDIYAFVDAEAVKKILSNLIGNAIKYAQNQINVTLSSTDEFLQLKIQNDGELIPEHLHKKIFEPFFRGTEDENLTGTGIGLSLAYTLTELHNGNLTLNIEGEKWNTFLLKLPIHQENEFKLQGQNDINESDFLLNINEDSEENPNKAKILLVEDNIDLLNFVAKDLGELYNIYKATNGSEALKIIEDKNIQLIVSDVMMPVMSGYELCKAIKSTLETSHIPVIFLTAKNTLNAKIEGLELGADAYLEKPFSIPHLIVQIDNLLENRKNVLSHYTSSPLAHLKSIALTETDETFISKLDKVILDNLSNRELNVDTLSEIMNMSRSTLYRKIKEMSNLSPNELINISRLKKAGELLKKEDYKIYEVADMVGFNSQTSFGRNFQKQFNMTPTEYKNNLSKNPV
ncbi:hybrid sensor histidine kinase/response regulator transcription factor [uncultured Algibacter sp.]|uniref:hybrid sensor histidine kinase/response regulator transcription factor n=1 Tax=uncultured Algibacter sp. TaxID=298659 RepID=UPI0026387654|nr:hybrid sensor histidine kinase/response regulator transcription factor [uncultured Algibacter sp.]